MMPVFTSAGYSIFSGGLIDSVSSFIYQMITLWDLLAEAFPFLPPELVKIIVASVFIMVIAKFTFWIMGRLFSWAGALIS